MIQIREWVVTADQWVAPECRGNPSLGGIANVPGLTVGEDSIQTSAIAKVDERIVTTKSGSVYRLIGEPHQFFLDDLARKGFAYNPERPLDCYLGDYIKID